MAADHTSVTTYLQQPPHTHIDSDSVFAGVCLPWSAAGRDRGGKSGVELLEHGVER